MRRGLFIAAALLLAPALTACETLNTPSLTEAPAPLANTTADDKALELAWKGFDTALDAIAVAREGGALKPGTPKAIAVANGIDKVLAAFKAAEHAAAGLGTKSYLVALQELQAALVDFRTVLRSK